MIVLAQFYARYNSTIEESQLPAAGERLSHLLMKQFVIFMEIVSMSTALALRCESGLDQLRYGLL
jgi:hypothetical protein